MKYEKPQIEIVFTQSDEFCAESTSSTEAQNGYTVNTAIGKDTLDD